MCIHMSHYTVFMHKYAQFNNLSSCTLGINFPQIVVIFTGALGEAGPQKSHYVVGTSFYVSPEQNKKKAYGEEVDIYALGIIYFEMNCPFGTETERSKV